MFDSGRGATRQLLTYRQIRQPDVATGIFTAAAVIGVAAAAGKRPAAGALIPATVVLAASAQHVRSRFRTPVPDLPRVIPAIAADSALLAAYFAGRLAGLAVLRQRNGLRRCG
jgi:hypothetical protein